MSYQKTPKVQQEDMQPQDEIVIERKEVVGRIRAGLGTDPMVVAAFKLVGDYLEHRVATNPEPEPVRLEFAYYGQTFVIIMEETGL